MYWWQNVLMYEKYSYCRTILPEMFWDYYFYSNIDMDVALVKVGLVWIWVNLLVCVQMVAKDPEMETLGLSTSISNVYSTAVLDKRTYVWPVCLNLKHC